MQVTIRNMDSEIRNEILDGYDLWETPTLYSNLQDGNGAVVDCVACTLDEDPEHNYYDITFEDGTVVMAISGYHLDGIENWT